MSLRVTDRRVDPRYSIEAPVSLSVKGSDAADYLLFLNNISASGALLSSTVAVPEHTIVTIRTKLPFLQLWLGRKEVEFIFTGKVVRTNADRCQIAIRFDEEYRIGASLPR